MKPYCRESFSMSSCLAEYRSQRHTGFQLDIYHVMTVESFASRRKDPNAPSLTIKHQFSAIGVGRKSYALYRIPSCDNSSLNSPSSTNDVTHHSGALHKPRNQPYSTRGGIFDAIHTNHCKVRNVRGRAEHGAASGT